MYFPDGITLCSKSNWEANLPYPGALSVHKTEWGEL